MLLTLRFDMPKGVEIASTRKEEGRGL
jgi:hypothetical protein